MSLQQLLGSGQVWQFSQQPASNTGLPTGFASLDLCFGGWPKAQITELCSLSGCGELRLLLPYLQQQQRLLVFINPPAALNAVFFLQAGIPLQQILELRGNPAESLWAAELCLKSGSCQTLLLWQEQLSLSQFKRLQLACQSGQAELFLYRSPAAARVTLPAALSLQLASHPQGLQLTVRKRRGGWAGQQLLLNWQQQWPTLYQPHSPSLQALAG